VQDIGQGEAQRSDRSGQRRPARRVAVPLEPAVPPEQGVCLSAYFACVAVGQGPTVLTSRYIWAVDVPDVARRRSSDPRRA
jgi:hypothetical protein